MLLRTPLKYILMMVLMIASCCTIAFATSVPNIHQPLWSVSFPTKAKPFNLAAHDQRLIVTFVDNSLTPSQPRSLAAATGKLQWQSKQTIFDVLATENNNIYAKNYGGEIVDNSKKLVTLNANTGKAKSVFSIKDAGGNSYEAMGGDRGAFILEESRSNQQGEAVLYAIKARTAQKTLWTFTAPANSQKFSSSVVKNGIVLVEIRGSSATEGKGSRLLALKASTGQELWTYQSLDSIDKQLIGNNVYVMTEKSIRALDAQTGRELWVNTSLGGTKILTGGGSKTKPNERELFILDNNNRTNSASTHLAILDRQTGKQLREINLPVQFESSRLSVLSSDTIYVVDLKVTEGGPLRGGNRKEADSWVNAFDASTGKLLWRTPEIKHKYIDSIVVSGDRLFLAANSLRSRNPDLPGLVQSFADR